MDLVNKELENNKQLLTTESSKEIAQNQNKFLKTTFGVAVNEAINYGLKKILPDFLENQVIEIKDALFNNGIKEGIETAIEKAVDLGKSAIGIFTGDFKKISQIETAVQKGGLIESTSKLIDKSLKKANKENYITDETTEILKEGKNIIKNSLNKSIKTTLSEQKQILENVEKCTENWKKYYQEKDFENMEKEYEKIKEELIKTIPMEETLQKVNEIENIHNLIKNNGQNFNITQEELEVAKKLI